jgi:hypothetical protein
MSYFKDIDTWLDKFIAVMPEDRREDAKREIKAKLLESYRNGQAAGREAGDGAAEVENGGGRPPVDFKGVYGALDQFVRALENIERNLIATEHDTAERGDNKRDSSRRLPGGSSRYSKQNR